jgi:hypothetical protein
MKISHKSKKTLEKYSNTFYKNKQNLNLACACHIYLINSIILFYLVIFKLYIYRCQPTNLIHQSELRTKVVPFKEKNSFHFVVL